MRRWANSRFRTSAVTLAERPSATSSNIRRTTVASPSWMASRPSSPISGREIRQGRLAKTPDHQLRSGATQHPHAMRFTTPDPWASNPKQAMADVIAKMGTARQKQAQRIAERAAKGRPLPAKRARAKPCQACLKVGVTRSAEALGLCAKHRHEDWRDRKHKEQPASHSED